MPAFDFSLTDQSTKTCREVISPGLESEVEVTRQRSRRHSRVLPEVLRTQRLFGNDEFGHCPRCRHLQGPYHKILFDCIALNYICFPSIPRSAEHPSFLLADDPTANLDTQSAMTLLELME